MMRIQPYMNYRMLISILKLYNIRRLVLCTGGRSTAFISAVERDEYFECYSIRDERNAPFFAMGIIQLTGEPVAVACTSGTAVSNMLSGMTEAYYSHMPLIIISFDRALEMLGQMETQKVDHVGALITASKKSVVLPPIKDEMDIWYCNRLLNEALIELNRHSPGPVHINVPLVGDYAAMIGETKAYENESAAYKILYIARKDDDNFNYLVERLIKSKKVMVIMGQVSYLADEERQALSNFLEETQCPLLADHLANFSHKQKIESEAVIKGLNSNTIKNILPDIVITIGGNFQERIKDLFRSHKGTFEHWAVNSDGMIQDVFMSQKVVCEFRLGDFFSMASERVSRKANYSGYFDKWKELEESISEMDQDSFNNYQVLRTFSKIIPDGSILHLSILNATRLMMFFKLDSSIKVFSNVNAFGIDGCLPTFMGEALMVDGLAFLVIGDISFFYGMNALGIMHRKDNIRILLINNMGGAEFQVIQEDRNKDKYDFYVGVEHEISAKGWAESLDYRYLYAIDKKSLDAALEVFTDAVSNKPMLLEVFTDMKVDGANNIMLYKHSEKCMQGILTSMAAGGRE